MLVDVGKISGNRAESVGWIVYHSPCLQEVQSCIFVLLHFLNPWIGSYLWLSATFPPFERLLAGKKINFFPVRVLLVPPEDMLYLFFVKCYSFPYLFGLAYVEVVVFRADYCIYNVSGFTVNHRSDLPLFAVIECYIIPGYQNIACAASWFFAFGYIGCGFFQYKSCLC